MLKAFVSIAGPLFLSMATADALAPVEVKAAPAAPGVVRDADVHTEMISMYDQTHHRKVPLSFSFQRFFSHVLFWFVGLIFCSYLQLYEVLHACLSFSKCVCVFRTCLSQGHLSLTIGSILREMCHTGGWRQ